MLASSGLSSSLSSNEFVTRVNSYVWYKWWGLEVRKRSFINLLFVSGASSVSSRTFTCFDVWTRLSKKVKTHSLMQLE